MEARTIAPRPDVALVTTAPRVTPTPPRAARFGEVLSRTVVRSAEAAMRVLPGSPMMAVAVRGATGAGGAIGLPTAPLGAAPEGPLAGGARAAGAIGPGLGTSGAGAVAAAALPGEGASVESSLRESQDMNLYFLQVQESVNAQNRSFTTLSNVLKAQHDTVKTAIGNIR